MSNEKMPGGWIDRGTRLAFPIMELDSHVIYPYSIGPAILGGTLWPVDPNAPNTRIIDAIRKEEAKWRQAARLALLDTTAAAFGWEAVEKRLDQQMPPTRRPGKKKRKIAKLKAQLSDLQALYDEEFAKKMDADMNPWHRYPGSVHPPEGECVYAYHDDFGKCIACHLINAWWVYTTAGTRHEVGDPAITWYKKIL